MPTFIRRLYSNVTYNIYCSTAFRVLLVNVSSEAIQQVWLQCRGQRKLVWQCNTLQLRPLVRMLRHRLSTTTTVSSMTSQSWLNRIYRQRYCLLRLSYLSLNALITVDFKREVRALYISFVGRLHTSWRVHEDHGSHPLFVCRSRSEFCISDCCV